MQDVINFISKHAFLTVALFCVFILVLIVEFIKASKNRVNISPAQTTQLINRQNAVLIDLRSAALYKQGHIIDAINLDSLDESTLIKRVDRYKNRPIIFIGSNEVSTQKIASRLLKQGYNAFSLTGGMRAWLEAQLPTVKKT